VYIITSNLNEVSHETKVLFFSAFEAMRGEKTISQIAAQFSVHPNQVSQWKKKLKQEAPAIFSRNKARKKRQDEVDKEILHRKIGRLTIERDWLKKKFETRTQEKAKDRACQSPVECTTAVPVDRFGSFGLYPRISTCEYSGTICPLYRAFNLLHKSQQRVGLFYWSLRKYD